LKLSLGGLLHSTQIKEKIGDIYGIGQTYNNLGLVYAHKGQWDTAIEYYEKSLEISEKIGDIYGIGQTYNNLGSVYAAKGQWDTAIEYYEKDLEISEKIGDIYGMWKELKEIPYKKS
jgi:tetratricopeptide (TPR) repeat protein